MMVGMPCSSKNEVSASLDAELQNGILRAEGGLARKACAATHSLQLGGRRRAACTRLETARATASGISLRALRHEEHAHALERDAI